MHSLYWRIFLAFWAALALILVGTLTAAVNATAHRAERPWIERGRLYTEAAHAFESGGPEALRSWLQGLRGEPFNRTFIVGPNAQEMLNRPLPAALYGPGETPPPAASGAEVEAGAIAPIGGALVLMTPAGSAYHVIIGPVRDRPRLFGELELPGVPLELLLIALSVSAGVCLVLARYLADPVERLRAATRQLASGDLNVRVLPALQGRQDDLGLLAADLDSMAERLRQFLEREQRLLRDVSHELRSPLTRLQLALSLARRDEAGRERHLARAALEAERLEQLIARTLRLVRLERPEHELEYATVDFGELLRIIAADVAIEAEVQGSIVQLQIEGNPIVSGDAEVLRSAFENVIRNAVRYSPPGAPIRVSVRMLPDVVEIDVRDQGPGVPEQYLRLIFQPFFRLDAAREHLRAGGEGLGLAIAARALTLHGGTIAASNATGGGLSVRISLPADGRAPMAQSSTATGDGRPSRVRAQAVRAAGALRALK
jgi:signal transduction histidine kinase